MSKDNNTYMLTPTFKKQCLVLSQLLRIFDSCRPIMPTVAFINVLERYSHGTARWNEVLLYGDNMGTHLRNIDKLIAYNVKNIVNIYLDMHAHPTESYFRGYEKRAEYTAIVERAIATDTIHTLYMVGRNNYAKPGILDNPLLVKRKFAFLNMCHATPEQILLAGEQNIEIVFISNVDEFSVSVDDIEAFGDIDGVIVDTAAAALRLIPYYDVGFFQYKKEPIIGSVCSVWLKAIALYMYT